MASSWLRPEHTLIRFDAATFLLQWATGGLAFLWLTTRRREVGLGYGWLLRSIYIILALGSFAAAQITNPDFFRDTLVACLAGVTSVALVFSIRRKAAGIAGVPPWLDLMAPIVGGLGLIAAAADAGGPFLLALARIAIGSACLGAVFDAMLLGHWYLVQPGLTRGPLLELVRATAIVWPLEVGVMLLPTGMVSVFTGAIDDGWNGLLGWMWAVCAVTTIGLCVITRAALRERQYAAVMAATGLLYLAILTAFGTDLVARAVLSV